MNAFIDSVCQPTLWFLADCTLRWILLIGIFGVWLLVFRPRRASTRYQVGLSVFLAGFLFPFLPRWGPAMEIPTMPSIPKVNSSAENGGPSDPNRLPITEEVMPLDLKGRDWTTELPNTTSIPSELPITPTPQIPSQNEPLGTRRTVVLGLSIYWAVGVTGLLLRIGIGVVWLARLRQKASAVSEDSARLLEACRMDLGMRRHAILKIHPAVRAPMALGWYHPTILVPRNWGDLSDQAQRGCLLHELAHLARWDDWLKLIQEFVRVFFFFNPFLLWLLARLEYERELLCDEAAIRRGIDPKDFVRILLKFAITSRRPVPEAIMGQFYSLPFGRIRTVKARITHLLEENMKHFLVPLSVSRRLFLGVLVLFLALGIGSFHVQALSLEEQSSAPVPAKHSLIPKEAPDLLPDKEREIPQKTEEGKKEKETYRVEPFHVLKIEVKGLLPGDQIKGFYLVEPDGNLQLGLRYGRVQIGGLTIEEASTAIRNQLRNIVRFPLVAVELAGWVTKWQDDPGKKNPYLIRPRNKIKIQAEYPLPDNPIGGPYAVDLDGNINLGLVYGKVKVAGLSLEEAGNTIRKHLEKFLKEPIVSVAMSGWENDWLKLEDGEDPLTEPPKGEAKKKVLRYGGKTFLEWREELKTELKPELRIEGFNAMGTFGVNG
ncbi:MAG TPA: M56 family metallopeptidase [Gemmataceae bacterium]|nr:M56 family metallopeptidase [Gemmataceae bacterium]